MRLVAAVAICLALAAVSAAGAVAPRLTVASRTPLLLAGSGFVAQERVTVTLITGLGPKRKLVVARSGRFRVQFDGPTRGCGAPTAARAVGDRGSRAAVVIGRAGVCVPPPRDQ